MIIKDYQLEQSFKEHKTFIAILLYGPNEGLVKEQIDKIVKNYLDKDDFEQINFNGKELDDPLSLDSVIRTVSMFMKKVVIANSIKDKHCSLIEKLHLKLKKQY